VDKIPKGFQDSKALSEQTRNKLFKQLLDHEHIGFCMRSLLPSEISRNMLRPNPYNLNQMSHDSTIVMIRKLIDAGVNVKRAYIDTVGNPATYKRKLEGEFPGVDFTVESKADANYAPCSAASVGKRKYFVIFYRIVGSTIVSHF
jgi:ribonuclease H2 subunit A